MGINFSDQVGTKVYMQAVDEYGNSVFTSGFITQISVSMEPQLIDLTCQKDENRKLKSIQQPEVEFTMIPDMNEAQGMEEVAKLGKKRIENATMEELLFAAQEKANDRRE